MSRLADLLRRLRRRPSLPRRQSAAVMPTVRYATSPLLASRTPPWRVKFLLALLGLGFVALIGRAAWIQIIHNDFYLKQGANRYERRIELPGARGRIFDRHGELLATSIPAPSLWAIPKDFEATPAQFKALAGLLDMKPETLRKRLAASNNFVWLRRQVDEGVARQVAELKLKGVHDIKEAKRHYPEGESAAHIVGFTNVEDAGQEGIELAFQKQLVGRDGERHVIKDRLGRVVESVGDKIPATDGQDIHLSIDAKVQFYAYQRIRDAVREHKAKAGSVVVLDAKTGEVLALANVPSYSPSDRSKLTGAQLRNRALTDTFEPGSTIKPLIAAWALESGRVRPDTVIQTSGGRFLLDGKTISDTHRSDALTVEQVIQKSSNVGVVKLALQMQPREMWEMFSAVGLGQKPPLGFPGVVTGRLRPHKSWRRIEQATMSYGYGLSASLFQLAQVYTIFASDGEFIPMSLLKRDPHETAPVRSPAIRTTDASVVPPFSVVASPVRWGEDVEGAPQVRGARVISPRTAQQMRKMLSMATGDGGTGVRAQTMAYSVGGKSGTARKQEGKGYADSKYRAWFVGIATISDPRIVVAVMVDEPTGVYYGGAVAAPVFSQVVQQTLARLGVVPDLAVQPDIAAMHDVEESF